ncbi:MAG: molecular chaperone HtpG [Rhodocyclales bacterium CG17_big_fil_post_rev_8_21_14_2_50_68_7]|nr:MAG: molecular chaperone HtpG [Betaproteobacteria bacterium CG2_30_68_42]PIV72424.1 MAG: molecular chaperone HtpG [Rhodocyclales bacterium CG17_big_fil_post_rev_8_21_14_2_50_68_7]PIX76327.1 MAG: molecular chaperone HtpG [Rhodocyclales bacterium CG_4_10_14_3_um_filter_68_10]PJA58400.1 MAG: molecular chaperone HtpG [Rhodocyclales bacterium CG_4_9_14_3_um_filter_68_10]
MSTEPSPTELGRIQTLGFQAEVKQLLHLMIHSLYSNREVFLRELVSNASDACDKLRFEALADAALFEGDPEPRVRISYDAGARTITVADNGIGMSREEAIEHLGTIAKSGTREFFSHLSGDQQKDAQLIGQFGVGFYSSFIVADRVTVLTRRAGQPASEAVRWESDGGGEFSVSAIGKSSRGTEVILHLREGQEDLLSGSVLRTLVRKYSDHIVQPILMKKERWDAERSASVITDEDETVNRAAALWARPKSEITEEQYQEFYGHVAHDFEPPLAHVHAKVEGRQEYTQLLFIPSHAPFDLWDRQGRHGIKLYVQRVFIMDDAEQLMPAYLRFVRGVVDANDLSLNVSREILQESRDIEAIRAGCTKRVLGLLGELADKEKEKYARFWGEFGRALKEGVGEDPPNRERIARLLRFASTDAASAGEDVSLADYVSRMKPGQEHIYYLTADSAAAVRSSPHLEFFRAKGIEVLLLCDRVDEWVIAHLDAFEGKPLRSVAKGDLDLGKLADEEEKREQEREQDELKDLVARIRSALGGQVKDVRVSHRLSESPACLVADEQDIGANLARILKSVGQAAPAAKPILEINPKHAIVLRLRDEEKDIGDWSRMLFDQALLAEGGSLEDPAAFVKRLNRLLLEVGGDRPRIVLPG